MASLTPGVLSKLLENAGNRVTSEHRQPLLQVTEIIPRLSEDTWQPNTGYFLKLSDSLHSAYVSVSDSDAELIRSDKLQLGQFVYVTRFDSDDSSSPVPLVRGLNPLPKRRPCIGNPIDLISSDSLHLVTHSKPNNNVKKKKKMNKGSMSGSVSVSGSVVRSQCNGNKKNNVVVEMRRLSLDSATRRVWDHTHSPVVSKTKPSSPSSSSSSRFNFNKSTSTSPNVIDKKVSLKTDSHSPLKKSINSNVSPLKNKNENLLCHKTTGTPPRKSAATIPKLACVGNVTVPSQLVKVPLNFKTWYDKSQSWDNLPHPICNLGKQVVTNRNVAFLAAVRSLEEASAADTVLQCMSLFSELCESRQTLSAGLLVKQFLELYLSLQRVKVAFDSLLSTPSETKPGSQITIQSLVEDACEVPTRKNATFWIQAALDTNFSKFNLYKTQEKNKALNGERCHYVIIENESSHVEMYTEESTVQNKKSHTTQANPLQNSTGKRLPSSKRNLLVDKNKDTEKRAQSKECELKVAASLAEKLLMASREWFLKYLEESISNDFGLKNEESGEVACLLGQLREVNQWLDNLDSKDKVDGRVEKLRTSLYRFLLEHVNSAVASS